MNTVATKAVVIPKPKPLLDRSNVHHRPRDKAARVSESCTLLSKLSFCVTRLLRQSLKPERRQFLIKYLLYKISPWNVDDTVRCPPVVAQWRREEFDKSERWICERIQHWRGWCRRTLRHTSWRWPTPSWICVALPGGCPGRGTGGPPRLWEKEKKRKSISVILIDTCTDWGCVERIKPPVLISLHLYELLSLTSFFFLVEWKWRSFHIKLLIVQIFFYGIYNYK